MKAKIEFLVKLRDAFQMAADATNDYIDSFAPTGTKEVAVLKETFNLKFEPQQGAKIGAYEVAYQPNNIPEKFDAAYNILEKSNATIKTRYHGSGYEFAYWLYGTGKIYRQKIKQKHT